MISISHKRKLYTLIIFTLLTHLPNLAAQTPFPALGKLYRDDLVLRIDVTLAPADLDKILAEENWYKDDEYPADVIIQSGSNRDTLRNVGLRLRGNTSRASKKKSFRISLNTFVSQKFEGVEEMNLNGEHNDPSIMRAKLCWDLLRQMGVSAPRANHTRLYINDIYRGLYLNVEHIDEEFAKLRFGNNNGNLYKCLYPATLEYLGENPNLYKFESGGRRAYELKTNETTDDYSDLARFIKVLNHTPTSDMPCELEKVFNIDSYLKSMAFDVLVGNWDGPLFNKNNFYLYKNTSTGQFEYMPYDLDNTFGVDWFNVDWANRNVYQWSPSNEPRPLFTKIMAVPVFKQRFSYYIKKFSNEIFNLTNVETRLNDQMSMIAPAAMEDTYRTLDYGYTFNDFERSYHQATGAHVKYGLKPYITTRRNSALTQIGSVADIAPIVANVSHGKPQLGDPIVVTASVEDETTPQSVVLSYQINGGGLVELPMQTVAGQAGIYTATMPPLTDFWRIEYHIVATDALGKSTRDPLCGSHVFSLQRNNIGLSVNELLASNVNGVKDEANEREDWVELYNGSNAPIFLGDKYLTDDLTNPTKWRMPAVSLPVGGFVLFWADEDGDTQPSGYHANFKLSKSGEEVGIFDANGTLLDAVVFGSLADDKSYARLPNGTGAFQVVGEPTPNASNQSLGIFAPNVGTLALFPNPTKGQFWVGKPTEWLGDSRDVQLRVFDVRGRVVFESQKFGGEPVELPSVLADGLYFVTIQTKSGQLYVGRVALARAE